MKQIFILFIVSLSLFSCDNKQKDEVTSLLINREIEHLETYNTIQSITTDAAVVKYIDSLKTVLEIDAIKTKIYLEENNLDSSIISINKYLELCK